ncbi:MAG: hypothetical protein WA842_13140 [Croceibacterium sp.]
MEADRISAAMARINAAVARLEAAAARPAPTGVPQAQHERLRNEAGAALAQLDRLIGSLEA